MANHLMNENQDTIVAVATAQGSGGIAVIRLSGPEAFKIADKVWKGSPLTDSKPNFTRYGTIMDPKTNDPIDDGLVTPFKGPASFTGEDTVEFGVHGSRWIQREVVRILIDAGARMADHGEFTRRAFTNGKLDLAQAEGIADLIASSSRASHRLALTQTRGGFSKRLEELREKLIEFASLLELELDFSEEDVEFADRTRLQELASETLSTVEELADSYATGRVLKEGVPVVIAGVPNAGKSTLLNAILGDNKAIVSEVPGTTRDVIEDTIELNGILFRFIDTAGLRETEDHVEKLGIIRTKDSISKAAIVIRLLDATIPLRPQIEAIALPFPSHSKESGSDDTEHKMIDSTPFDIKSENNKSKNIALETDIREISVNNKYEPIVITVLNKTDLSQQNKRDLSSEIHLALQAQNKTDLPALNKTELLAINKTDPPALNNKELSVPNNSHLSDLTKKEHKENIEKMSESVIQISAKTGEGIPELIKRLTEAATPTTEADLTVTNARHYEALIRAAEALRRATEALQTDLSADFIAQDIREALHHLGLITGAITTPDLLNTLFSRFCIGK